MENRTSSRKTRVGLVVSDKMDKTVVVAIADRVAHPLYTVLSDQADFELFKHFGFQSGRDVDKFTNFTGCARGADGLYYITEGTNAYISVTVDKTVDLGSHTMFIGEITDMAVLSDTPSTTYEYYQNHIKPKPQAVGKTDEGQTVWRCRICGYEYVGEEIPDDFICPICKHPASDFEKIVK